jgi:hypothetical protein
MAMSQCTHELSRMTAICISWGGMYISHERGSFCRWRRMQSPDGVIMSVFDKAVAAVTPAESEEMRRDVRTRARGAAVPGDWLLKVLDYHERIETAFVAMRSGTNAVASVAARKRVAVVLTGHANAEESVIYPALARVDGHAS